MSIQFRLKSQLKTKIKTAFNINAELKDLPELQGKKKTLTYEQTADWLLGKEVKLFLQRDNSAENKLKEIVTKRNWYAATGISSSLAYKYKNALLDGTMKLSTMKKLLERLK